MRALVADGAAPGRIALHDVPEPIVAPGDVLVDVRAVSLNRGEMRMLGTAADGWRPGWDFAGVLHGDGPGGLRAGARVLGIGAGGSWAQRVAVPAGWVAALPDTVTFAQAAALPTAGLTAIRTLRLGPAILGRRVLVTGASGGVGRFAVQVARLGGAHVTALVGSRDRAASVCALGAHDVLMDVSELRGVFDLILESVGGDTLAALLTKIDPDGTLVMFGNSSGQTTTFNARDLYLDAGVPLRGFELFHQPAPFGRDLAYLAGLVAEGALDPQLADELPWTEMPAALRRLGNREVSGKLAPIVM